MQKRPRKVTIRVPEKCSITYLCNAVVWASGKNPEDFSCETSKLVVSRDIYNAFRAYITDLGWDQSTADELWSKSGITINESFVGGEVELLDEIFAIASTSTSKPPIGKAIFSLLLSSIIHVTAQYSSHSFANSQLETLVPLATFFQVFDVVFITFVILVGLIWIGNQIGSCSSKDGIGR